MRITCIEFLSPAGDLLKEETRGLRRQNRNQSKLKKFGQEHISTAPAEIGVLFSNSGQETHRGQSIELQSSEIKSRRATDLERSRKSPALVLNTGWQKFRRCAGHTSTSPLIEGAILARFSPAPHLSLVWCVHDSSKTGKKNLSPVHPFFSF